MRKVAATHPKKGRVGLASRVGENRERPQDSGLVTITPEQLPPQALILEVARVSVPFLT